MTETPGATPVTSPEAETLATAGALLDHDTDRPASALPRVSKGVATRRSVSSGANVAAPAERRTEATGVDPEGGGGEVVASVPPPPQAASASRHNALSVGRVMAYPGCGLLRDAYSAAGLAQHGPQEDVAPGAGPWRPAIPVMPRGRALGCCWRWPRRRIPRAPDAAFSGSARVPDSSGALPPPNAPRAPIPRGNPGAQSTPAPPPARGSTCRAG